MTLHKRTLMLVGGGTGGHIIPIFELYKELSKIDKLKVVVVGSGGDIEKRFYSKIPNYEVITAGKLIRGISLRAINELIKFKIGLWQSFLLLRKHRPSLIFSKGGYVSLPIIITARLFKIPLFIHESDLEMGLANRIGLRSAKKIFVGFPLKNYQNIPKEKAVFSGQVIGKDFLENTKRDLSMFGFKDNKPIIFVTGGSQGARKINHAMFSIIDELANSYDIIHQVGSNDIADAKSIKGKLGKLVKHNYFPAEFFTEEMMTIAMNCADLVIARAGATTIAELAAKQKAMVLVPYKYASANHQFKNAKLLQDAGAAELIKDDDLSPELLYNTITKLLGSKSKLANMGRTAASMFNVNGLDTIVNEIKQQLNKKYEEV